MDPSCATMLTTTIPTAMTTPTGSKMMVASLPRNARTKARKPAMSAMTVLRTVIQTLVAREGFHGMAIRVGVVSMPRP